MKQPYSDHVMMDGLRSGNNFVLAVMTGGIAAMVAALIWWGLTAVTGLSIEYVAPLGVAAWVGLAVRFFGKGASFIFGVVGVAWTLAGCLGGEILAASQLASDTQVSFLNVLLHIDLGRLMIHLVKEAVPIKYLVYALSIFQVYWLSIREK